MLAFVSVALIFAIVMIVGLWALIRIAGIGAAAIWLEVSIAWLLLPVLVGIATGGLQMALAGMAASIHLVVGLPIVAWLLFAGVGLAIRHGKSQHWSNTL
jgi:hypothetical protein